MLAFPKPGSAYSANAEVDVVKGRDDRWEAAKRDAVVEAASTGSRADALWLAVPLAVLALIVVLPISIGIGVWLRNRRAAAEWYRPRS